LSGLGGEAFTRAFSLAVGKPRPGLCGNSCFGKRKRGYFFNFDYHFWVEVKKKKGRWHLYLVVGTPTAPASPSSALNEIATMALLLASVPQLMLLLYEDKSPKSLLQ